MSSDKNKVDPKTVEPLVKLISSIFVSEPSHESLKTTINTLNPVGVKATSLFNLMKLVINRQEKGEILVDDFMIPQIKQVIAIIEARMALRANQKLNNNNFTPAPNNQDSNTETTDKDQTGNNSSQLDGLEDLSDTESTGKSSHISQSDLHTSTLEAKRKRALEIYDIVKPKNIRLQKPTPPNHVYDWNPIARKFVVYVSGEDYTEDIVFLTLQNAKQHFGTMVSLDQQKSHAVIILEDEPKRQAVIDILKTSELKLVVSEAQYRPPIIKFEVNFPITESDIQPLLKEIRDFNLKQFPDNKFELFKMYKIRGTDFTVICVRIDATLRDYIVDEGKARFWYRQKTLIISDYFDTRKCYVCGQCGHWKCKARQRICMKCSGLHKKASCKSHFTMCPSCRGPHEAFDIRCPKFIDEMNRDMNNVDYIYTKVMWTPLF